MLYLFENKIILFEKCNNPKPTTAMCDSGAMF